MQTIGNARAALTWEYHLPKEYKRPVDNDAEMESFIRAKYEYGKYKRKPTDPALEAPSPRPVAPSASSTPAPVEAVRLTVFRFDSSDLSALMLVCLHPT